ncbi:preprotein translocase subunit SecE [Candidatus Microgenomates bacterium]|nr:preprotein translocase subunit SecE [Candidatus Microgenomates bacterium]
MIKCAVMPNVINFVKEVRGEFNNIVWPSRQEALRLSVIVILVSVAIGAFVGALDFGFTNLLNRIVR